MIFGITATPSVDEDNFELVPEEELGHINLL